MKVKEFLGKRLGLVAGVTGSVAVGIAGLNYVFSVNETSQPKPTPTVVTTKSPTVSPTVVPTAKATVTSTPKVTTTIIPSPKITSTTTPTVVKPKATLTEKDNAFIKAIQNSSDIAQGDKEELKKFPNTLVLVGQESCKYNETIFIAGASVAISKMENKAFVEKFSNKPELYKAIHRTAKTTICK